MVDVMIRLEEVSKTFYSSSGGCVQAIDRISLDVCEGEFLAIVGPSGCGKTTLLKLTTGLELPTTGKIFFQGSEIRGPRSDVGMVFQEPTLLIWRDVLENVLFPIEILGKLKKSYVDEARSLLRLVGLDGFEKRRPDELSGGMQQRVGICRALIHDPSLLVMDEPFGALDAMTRDEMGIWLLRLWHERKKTVMFVTHDIREAVLLADRVVVVSERPARIIREVKVDLPRPRKSEMEFWEKFTDQVAEIRSLICGAADERDCLNDEVLQ